MASRARFRRPRDGPLGIGPHLAAGVLLGGILTDGLGWQWVLWVNVPVALIALALTPGLLPESRSESATRHFDAAGAVLYRAAHAKWWWGTV